MACPSLMVLGFAIGGHGVTPQFSVALLFLLSTLGTSNITGVRAEPAPDACTLTQTIRIPVHMQNAQEKEEAAGADPSDLMVSPGAAEEPPEGPTAFDVLADGSFLISDPLRHRISVFDAQ